MLAFGVCADCFAVSICAGTTVGNIAFRKASAVALSFAFVQTSFFLLGWALG